MSENKLEVIVKESQLEATKAQYILDRFNDYYQIAAEWEIKAKAIVVTDESQKTEMEKAREGRLFLRDKRTAIEKARKKMKEDSLKEGKSIDKIARFLTDLIVPIENWLVKQEKFVEIKEETKREAKRQEIEKRMEEEEQARQRAENERLAAETERIRKENEQLRKEAEERDRKEAIERKKRETRLANERAKAAAEREVIEKKLRVERAQAEKEKQEAEDKVTKEKNIAWAREQAEKREKERLAELLRNQITCPKCNHKFQLEEGKK